MPQRAVISVSCPMPECTEVHTWSSESESFPIVICPQCRGFIEIEWRTSGSSGTHSPTTIGARVTVRTYRDYVTNVPEAFRNTIQEAINCYNANAWNGSVALSRKAVEVIASDLGGKGNSLYAKIEDLKRRDLFEERVAVADHWIRNLGNLAVHFDPKSSIACKEAEATVALAHAYGVSKAIYLEHSREMTHEKDTDWLALVDGRGFHSQRAFGR